MEFKETAKTLRYLGVVFTGLVLIATGTQASGQNWEQLVAAAQREGKVVVSGVSGAKAREALTKGFQADFPKIQVEYSGIPARQIAPRIMAERRVGKKLWDIYVGGGNTPVSVFKPGGAILELRPFFILPEVRRDKNWHGGLDYGFVDTEKKFVYAHGANVDPPVYVNRTSIPAADFSDPKQLIDPKFKGKIVMQDPRGSGAGLADLYILYSGYGTDFIKKLLTEQKPVITRNYRQISEWLIRGRYPIGVGVSEGNLSGFVARGLGKDIERVLSRDVDAWNPIASTAALFEGAPHPNAAKLYLNWLLSKNTQKRYSKATGVNSRRADVSPVDSKLFPDPQRLDKYVRNDENGNKIRLKARDIARGLIK